MQGSRFLLAVALGVAYGLHYDLLRGLRRNLRWLTPGTGSSAFICWSEACSVRRHIF